MIQAGIAVACIIAFGYGERGGRSARGRKTRSTIRDRILSGERERASGQDPCPGRFDLAEEPLHTGQMLLIVTAQVMHQTS
jgi:hypothetical protein